MKPAVCLVGHGSRDPAATQEFHALVDKFRERDPGGIVEAGFLEFAEPMIQPALDRCIDRGAESVIVLPGMLMAAGHAKNDIPSEIHEARRRHPKVQFHYGRHLHLHPKIIQLCRLRIEEAEALVDPCDRADTLLLVVGRGSSDPDANADVQKLARMLGEGLSFGWSAACYSGVTSPLVPEALWRLERMGYARIIVFPFFLFTGILEQRIRQNTVDFRREQRTTEIISAGYLDVHPLLIDVLLERAEEAIAGSPHMNCELCKYRVSLPGFESAVGEPQVGHHHHVRGIGQDPGHSHGYGEHFHHHPAD